MVLGGFITWRRTMRKFIFTELAIILCLLLTGGAYALNSTTFNSNTNSSTFGNETKFFRVKNAHSPDPGFTNGTINIQDEAVLMQAYVNNSNASVVAQNTILTITLPTGFAVSQSATATLRSDNTGTMSDSVSMTDGQPFGLVFDQNAPVNVAKRSGTGENNYMNTPTGNYSINGNVMTVNLGDWVGGTNQQGVVTVRVLVTRQAPAPAPTPAPAQTSQPVAFVCTLSKSPTSNTFTAESNASAAGATVSSYNFVVKDSNGNIVDNQTLSTSAFSASYSFIQTNPGTYTVSAVINSNKGSTSSSSCTQQITVAQPAVLPATTTATPVVTSTPAPAKVPNTGASVLGVFTGTSVLGAFGHYIFRRYRP